MVYTELANKNLRMIPLDEVTSLIKSLISDDLDANIVSLGHVMLSIFGERGREVYGFGMNGKVANQKKELIALESHGLVHEVVLGGPITDAQKRTLCADIENTDGIKYQLEGRQTSNNNYNCISWVLRVLQKARDDDPQMVVFQELYTTYSSLYSRKLDYNPIPAIMFLRQPNVFDFENNKSQVYFDKNLTIASTRARG